MIRAMETVELRTSFGEMREKAADAAIAAARRRAVIPGLALILVNGYMYSGTVSMSLRATGAGRLFWLSLLFFAGAAAGGAAFFPLFDRAQGAGTAWRRAGARALLVVLLGASAATVLPGFRQYLTNEPLRHAAAFASTLLVAPAYYLFFSRFPERRRSFWFGLSCGLGIALWGVLSFAVRVWPDAGRGGAEHPLHLIVYLIHASCIVLLAALCIWTLVLAPGASAFIETGETGETEETAEPPSAPAADSDSRTLLRLLFAVPVGMCFLNGILGARLTPTVFSNANTTLHLGFCVVVAVAAPLAGWLTDRDARSLPRFILPVCCGVFLFAPTLAAADRGEWMHTALQPLTAAAHYVAFALCTVAAAGLAEDARRATRRAAWLYALRVVHVAALLLWGPVLAVGRGVTVLAATAAACALLALAWTLRSTAGRQDGGQDAGPDASTTPAADSADGVIDGFLSPVELTAREREVAALLLRGKTTLDMAFALNVTERTIKKHLSTIFRKSGVANARELYARCFAIAAERTEAAADD